MRDRLIVCDRGIGISVERPKAIQKLLVLYTAVDK